jgi:predicted acylesterase/phospholipase RssA
MNTQTSVSALVIEGGALRGVFSTGILDGFLKAGFNPFDFYMGVSSGASNLAAFLAEMPGRNYRIYKDYARRREFIDSWRFVRGGHLMDLDWLWEITIREMRLDLSKIYSRRRPFLVGLTDMETGCKAFRRDFLDRIVIEEDRFGFEPEITAKIARLKARIYEVGISYSGRTYAEGKKICWRDGVHALWCILKYNLLRR